MISGEELINLLVERLKIKNIPPSDNNIIIELRSLNPLEMSRYAHFRKH